MESVAAALPWFAGLEPEVREALVAQGRVRALAAGEWLHGEGDAETGLVAVLEGGLYLHAQAPGGTEALVSLLTPGAVIGQSIPFGGGPRLTTAIAAVASRVFILSDHALRRAAHEHPDLWRSLSALVYAQLRVAIAGLAEFVALKPRDRFASRLLQLSAFANPIPASQAALAEMAGVTRNAAHGWLRELEAEGLVRRGYGAVAVTDRAGLARRLA